VTSTSYVYDRDTFRLIHLYTRRGVDPLTRLGQAFTEDCTNPYPPPFTVAAPETPPEGHSCGLQNLRYTYDPVGNISHIRDDAQQTIFFRNRRVEPSADYVYDATYRLIEASGREHLGQTGGLPQPPVAPDAFDSAPTRLEHPGDGQAMGRYLERYVYDAVGNIMTLEHRGSDPTHAGWTLDYTYDESSLIDATQPSNRLSSTTVGGGAAQRYTYDGHGNMTRLPHLPLMRWDYRDQLQATARQSVVNGGTPETTYYVYDADGQRLRQVTERQTPAGETPTRLHERIYLNGFEISHEYEADGETVRLQRETLHVMAGQQRVALVETRTQGSDPAPAQLIRYQLGNHLGSASLELDGAAQVISYEEYYPYGSTSYQAVRSQSETPKRYRYGGRERDEASGLIYYGARYYAPWLARWTAADPLGLEDGIHLYAFVANNPVRWTDANGMQVDEYHDFDGLEVQGSGRTLDLIRTASRARQEALRMGDAELAAEYWREMQDLRRQFMREGDIEYAKFAVGTMTIATAAALTGGAAAFGGAALAGSLGLGTVGTGVLVGGAGGAGGAGGKAVAEWALGRDLTGEELMTEMAIGGAFGGVVGLGGGLYLRSATAPTAQSSPVSRVPEEIVMHRWSTGPKSPSLAPRPPEGPIEAFGLRQSSGAMTSRINLQIINKGPDPRFPGYPDNTGKGLWHAWERHGGVDNPGASQFTISLDKLQSLLNAPGVVQAPTYQLNTGNYIRTVQLRQVIGHTAVNRGGEQTPLLTVITDPHGNLVTAFPGTLSGKALVR
jgi:RHS repeat-associated protein